MLSHKLSESVPRTMHEGNSPQLDSKTSNIDKNSQKVPHADTEDAEYTDIVWTKSLSIHECSQEISKSLDVLLRGKPADTEKENYEGLLESATKAVPEPLKALTQCYPQNYLSEILITNYADLVKFCLLYLNLTLSLKVTKFVVNLFYSLECWEIYHLLQMIPNLDYFLRLVDIEVTDTPFGHVVSPPDNYMGFNLRQGFQYPFPFPFYNFSYHTMNPDVTNQKYQRLRIDNYIDIRLNKAQPKKKKKTRAPKKSSVSQEASPQRLLRQDSAISENSQEFTFQKVTHRDIAFDIQTVGELEDDDDGYTTDEAERILQDENRAVPMGQQGLVFVPSIFQHLVLPGGLTSGPVTRLSSLHEFQEPPLASVQRPDLPALPPHQNPQLVIRSPREEIKKEGSSLAQPPSFISQAPIPASLQYPPQYKDPSRLPYYGTSSRMGSHPLPQFPAYASALPPPATLVSPQLKTREEGHQDNSPQLQRYGYQGYPAFQPYGQPFYGDRRLFMQMPMQGYVPMGVPPQKLPGQGIPQNMHSPQYQQQFIGSMPMPPLGYQYPVADAAQPHGSPPMHAIQSNPTPPPPGSIHLPHLRDEDKSKKK